MTNTMGSSRRRLRLGGIHERTESAWPARSRLSSGMWAPEFLHPRGSDRPTDKIVTDTTDGAIVIFGSAGSEVRENTVYSRTRVVLGGQSCPHAPWSSS